MDWDSMAIDTRSSRRDGEKTKAIVEGALRRRDKSATAIAAHLRSNGVDVKDSYATTVVNSARITFDFLIGAGKIESNGSTYLLSRVTNNRGSCNPT